MMQASGMQPDPTSPAPRHRGDYITRSEPDVVFTTRPSVLMPSPGETIDTGVGFRSTREVFSEMNPVIYRPAGSGPERDPEEPPRVPIAGPGIPTAASFADDTDTTAPAPAVHGDDPEAAEEHPEPVDTDPSEPLAPPAAALRRPSLQRRRRRILGRSHDNHDLEPEPDAPARASRPVEPRPLDPYVPDDALMDADDPLLDDPLTDEALPNDSGDVDRQPDAPRPRKVRTLHMSAPPVGPAHEPSPEANPEDSPEVAAEASPELEDDAPVPQIDAVIPAEELPAAEAGTATVGGHVLSTRGRGLSGITLVVVDPDNQVVGEAVTGRRGRFVVEHLPAGTYRIGARDAVDGDFVDSWHGGDDVSQATELHLDADGALTDIDITLIGRVAIDAAVDVQATEAVVDIAVLDRSTGLPGDGVITVSTEQFRAELPLTDGRASITLFGSTADVPDQPRLAPRLRLAYAGSQHSSAATRTIRLR